MIDARTGKPIQRPAGTLKEGGRMATYLMEIPQEFFDEDFEAKQESLNEMDNAIYTGRHKEDSDDKRYVPRSTPINVRVERGMGR